MNGFAVDWLDLREAADAKARNRKLLRRLGACGGSSAVEAPSTASAARPRHGAESTDVAGHDGVVDDRPLDVFDLGGGTGANLRMLAPVLGGRQCWRVVDHDPALLAAQPDRIAGWARTNGYEHEAARGAADADGDARIVARMRVQGASFAATVAACRIDLSAGLTGLDPGPHALVTASALLDLVSSRWLVALIGTVVSSRAAGYFALTYDGRIEISPADPFDAQVLNLVNAHQHRDKGFGPALGPQAVGVAARHFRDAGYVVETAASDWVLGAEDRLLQHALVDGWIDAAREVDPGSHAALEHWRSERRMQIATGAVRMRVGHQDLLALPGRPSSR